MSPSPVRSPGSKVLKVIPPIKGGRKRRAAQTSGCLPTPKSLLATKGIPDPKLSTGIFGRAHRSARAKQIAIALRGMEMRYYDSATRDIFTGALDPAEKQTLALMFQKDFWAFKDKGRFARLPKLEKKAE